MFAILQALSAFSSWIKFGAIIAVLLSGLYLVNDYKSLGKTVEAQKATIVRLQNNIKVLTVNIEGTKAALSSLDEECQRAADRFLNDDDIMKRIDESADPLTDAANYDPNKVREGEEVPLPVRKKK